MVIKNENFKYFIKDKNLFVLIITNLKKKKNLKNFIKFWQKILEKQNEYNLKGLYNIKKWKLEKKDFS